MKCRQAPVFLIGAAASLLLQSCVEYYPASAFNPPQPQSPPPPPDYVAAPVAPQAPPTPPAATAPGPDDALVAPVALYPDPLIALILPASTVPSQISAASGFLIQYGDTTGIDSQLWDPSVRALAHYPTVITWMGANIAWTRALGHAFISSPSEVMDAIQRMRARAVASGALVSTPQQQVYSDGGEIEIYPTQPDSVYVPFYDDSVVFGYGISNGYGGPFLSFSEPFPEGPWLSFYFDWASHQVWAGDRNVWRERNGWQPPRTGGDRPPPGAHAWHPPGGFRSGPPAGPGRMGPGPHPRGMPGAPVPPPGNFRKPETQPGVAVPGNPAPQSGQPRPNGLEAPQFAPRPVSSLPPPPVRVNASAPARGSAPVPSSRSEPARGSAPSAPAAPAPAGNSHDPQK